MAVPKKRRSYTRRHLRRANHALGKIGLTPCRQCGEPTLPHRFCPSCQTYRGKKRLAAED